MQFTFQLKVFLILQYINQSSQIIYYNTNRTVAQNSDHKIQTFKLKLSNNSLAHCLSVLAYSDYWIKVKLGMLKLVKQGKSNQRELKNQSNRNLKRENTCKCICKIPQFWAKDTNTAHHTFLERRHLEVTKESYYVQSSEGSQQKGASSQTIMI